MFTHPLRNIVLLPKGNDIILQVQMTKHKHFSNFDKLCLTSNAFLAHVDVIAPIGS